MVESPRSEEAEGSSPEESEGLGLESLGAGVSSRSEVVLVVSLRLFSSSLVASEVCRSPSELPSQVHAP